MVESREYQKHIADLKHHLYYTLLEMIRVSLKATPKEVLFGHPCSRLIERSAQIGIKALIGEIFTPGKFTEFRLNGAGLKMFINDQGLTIGGDQIDDYPDTAPKMLDVIFNSGIYMHRKG